MRHLSVPDPVGLHDLLPQTARLDGSGMTIGECEVAALAAAYGTPLYVYDEHTLRDQARSILAVFPAQHATVSFASKACDLMGVMAVLRAEGLNLDVVSEGQIEAGILAGFPPDRMHLHGNAKSDAELELAANLGLRAIVLDGLDEFERLDRLARTLNKSIRVLLRLTLAIEAETHPHMQTSGYRSKFGVPDTDAEYGAAVRRILGSPCLQLEGLHVHLGSQIRDQTLYRHAAERLLVLAQEAQSLGAPIGELSVGGGWAVASMPGDTSLAPAAVAHALECVFQSPYHLGIEPGRALVARAAVALYTVRSVKSMDSHRVVAVDGGMGDNPRPALYGARYTAFAPYRKALSTGLADVVGRFCESGDVLAKDVLLPEIAPGDLLCMPMAGAYHLSMASTYNLVPTPAAIMVREGDAHLIQRRGTVHDILSRQVRL
jgi:diaminopimelate decarboxylase